MNPFDRLEVLLGVVGELLKAIPMHKGSITHNLTPEIMMKLDRLERAVAEFRDLNNRSFSAAKVDITQLKRNTMNSPQTSPKHRDILRRAEIMASDAKRLQSIYAQILAKKQVSPLASDKLEQKVIKDRRNRYKPIGGNKKWKPV